ncbi:MAG: hypothetical protein JNM89_02085 [Hyphomicrobiaceae bacterium]|nr:hypothetical protein [Hyphomicrobiaceae bacterium]
MDADGVALLRDIKFNLNLLLAATFFVVVFSALRFIRVVRQDIGEALGKAFKTEAETLFEIGELAALIETCAAYLKTRPNHAYALWFLGRAYFAGKDYESARIPFERLNELEPAWDANIRPFLNIIDAERGDDL